MKLEKPNKENQFTLKMEIGLDDCAFIHRIVEIMGQTSQSLPNKK
jgi:hypothetical protein